MPGPVPFHAPDRSYIDLLPEPALITAGPWVAGGADILHVNDRFCALTGYAAAELEGRNTRLLHGPRSDMAPPRPGQAAALAPEGGGEGWLYQKNGAEFYARWNHRPLTAAPDGPLLVVYHDQTELWRQREALLRSEKLDTVGLLAGGMAHDFNNLLSIINGYCEILGPKIADQTGPARDLREIHRAGLKASAIARQILQFSRRESTEPQVINFNTLTREISEIIRRVCGESIAVELRLASDLGNARINATRFQQVLLNLVFNARDAMPNGGRLTLRTRNQTLAADNPSGLSAGDYVAMEVSDQGTGIPPDVLRRIFEPFYTTKPHGTGLGLPFAQRLLRLARGDLVVESTVGRGTTFTLWLPETAEPEELSITVLSTLPVTQGSESVLVIEQEDALRKMITGILAIDGYAVSDAASAEDAERLGGSPQLIIADTASPEGRRILQLFRAKNPALLLISTANEPPPWPDRSGRSLAHLTKPFVLSCLIQEVRRLLDSQNR